MHLKVVFSPEPPGSHYVARPDSVTCILNCARYQRISNQLKKKNVHISYSCGSLAAVEACCCMTVSKTETAGQVATRQTHGKRVGRSKKRGRQHVMPHEEILGPFWKSLQAATTSRSSCPTSNCVMVATLTGRYLGRKRKRRWASE